MIDKNLIILYLKDAYSKQVGLANEVASKAHNLLTQDDMKPEGKYDTRRVEAGYLAGAQKVRLEEAKFNLERISNLELPNSNQKVVIGSLVECIKNEKENELIFITPTSGGLNITIDNIKIHIISNQSPLGDELLTMEENDVFEVKTPKGDVEYEILKIY